ATGVIMRLVNMGVEPFLISSSVVLVAAQRLVRKVCPRCKESYDIPKPILDKLKIKPPAGEAKFYRGKGCDYCFRTGFRGRIGLIEAVTINAELRDLIAKRAHETQIYEASRRAGLVTLRESGLRKVFQGLTTLEEVVRVTLGEQD
ncbi:MAG TPA: type II secretion system protein GspE, partial [Candidatus Omnitrophota bacterium]|nr:type II secretion system protein GspE [Candidatus Omnitrophota bacterium]